MTADNMQENVDSNGMNFSYTVMQQFSGKGQRFLVLVQFAQYLIHTAALARWQNAPKNIRNRLNGFPVWLGLNSPG